MNLNVINNFKAMYYNTLTNFYLYFNTFVPYYDDVILTLSITSFKNIIKSSKIKLKENRLLQLIYSLDDKDNIVVDDDGFIFVDYYIKEAVDADVAVEAVVADADNVIHDEDEADEADEADAVVEADEADATDTEAVATDTEAVATDTEAVATDTEAVATDTEAVETDTEAVETDTEAVAADTEAVAADTEAVATDTEAVATDTEAVETVAADTECYNSIEKKNN